MVGKGEIACYKQFLLFPKCFQKACFPGASKGVVVWEWVKFFKWHFTLLSTVFQSYHGDIKAFADDNSNVAQMEQFYSDSVENIVGERRKCWFPAFSPFLTMFSEGFFFWVVKTCDCLGNG